MVALALAAIGLGQEPPPAPMPKPTGPRVLPEYELKAGLLFQFARYTQWPETAFAGEKAPLIIAVLGADPFGDVLDRVLKEKSVKTREIQVQRFATPADVKTCHVLFIPKGEATKLPEALRIVEGKPVLTIGEEAVFVRGGGCLAILVENEKPKLEVNLKAVRASKLIVDAKVLKVATVIGKE